MQIHQNVIISFLFAAPQTKADMPPRKVKKAAHHRKAVDSHNVTDNVKATSPSQPLAEEAATVSSSQPLTKETDTSEQSHPEKAIHSPPKNRCTNGK